MHVIFTDDKREGTSKRAQAERQHDTMALCFNPHAQDVLTSVFDVVPDKGEQKKEREEKKGRVEGEARH
jgi:hypothetical protein